MAWAAKAARCRRVTETVDPPRIGTLPETRGQSDIELPARNRKELVQAHCPGGEMVTPFFMLPASADLVLQT